MIPKAFSVFIASSLLALTGPFLSAQESEPGIPNTAAGRAMARMIECIEQPEAQQRTDFLTNGFGPNVPPLRQRIQFVAQMHSDLKKLRLKKVLRSEPFLAEALFESTTDHSLKLTIYVTENEPGKISDIDLEIKPIGNVADAKPLTAETRSVVLNSICQKLADQYVFPEVAAQMVDAIKKSQAAGEFDDVKDKSELGKKLTSQLMAICNDKHFDIRASQPDSSHGQVRRISPVNHGFSKVEYLEDGIGYLKFDFFSGDPEAEVTAAAAMNFLANSKAIIVDLRENGGGNPGMIAFLTSYLFDERVHLNNFYNRISNQTTESWTRDDVPGPRPGGEVPVFVLTSNYTFSGAEEFAYNLQALKRGTIVGEVTGGGAHPVRRVLVEHGMSIKLPYARAINPVTGTNWEGVGVQPEVKVAADQALASAMELARQKISEGHE